MLFYVHTLAATVTNQTITVWFVTLIMSKVSLCIFMLQYQPSLQKALAGAVESNTSTK